MDDRTYTRLYVEQLRTALADVLAICKPRWVFRGHVWDERERRARYLLQQRRAFSAGESNG